MYCSAVSLNIYSSLGIAEQKVPILKSLHVISVTIIVFSDPSPVLHQRVDQFSTSPVSESSSWLLGSGVRADQTPGQLPSSHFLQQICVWCVLCRNHWLTDQHKAGSVSIIMLKRNCQ